MHLRVLGGAVALSPPDAPGDVLLGQGKPLAILTYLACSPRRSASREHLVDLLWADLAPDRARHALRQTVWYLRQLLGADSLLTHGDALELAAPLRLDRDDFLSAVAAGDLTLAASIYTGDFLTGFAAPGSVEFEHWADIERQHLRSVFVRVAETLVRRWLNEGRLSEAQPLARRARDADPSSDSSWRLLFETLIQSGDRLALTLEADQFEQRLAALGRTPDPATRALFGRAKLAVRPADTEADTPGLSAELIGREREFGAIVNAWQRGSLTARQFHVSAPAGLGKTRLLTDVAVRLRTLGARVIFSRSNPGEQSIAYSFIAALIEQLAAEPGAAAVSPATAGILVALNPTLSARFSQPADTATGEEALRRRAVALSELLRVLAEENRLALLLDDLHWLDPSSRRVLTSALAQVTTPGLLIVTAARPLRGADAGPEGTDRLELLPLSAEQIGALTASLGQLPPEPWCQTLSVALARSTGGSPLLVLETLQLAIDRAWLRLEDHAWRCDAPEALARGLEAGSALRHRIGQLDDESRRILLLLAVAGTPLPSEMLMRAARIQEEALASELGVLERRGFVQRSGSEWQPGHDEIAADVVAMAEPEALRRAHGAIGHALASNPISAREQMVRAGRHLRAAGATAELTGVFGHYLRAARRVGDGRRVGEVAYEFLGEGTEVGAVLQLVRGIPPWTRLRYSSARGVGVGALLILGLFTLMVVATRRPPPDLSLVVFERDAHDHVRAVTIGIGAERWDSDQPLELRGAAHASVPEDLERLPASAINQRLPNPSNETWAWSRHLPPGDSGVIDVYSGGLRSRSRRLTAAARDDNAESWSPDGQRLLITTSRWSPPGEDAYDIAVLDTVTGAVRRLTFALDPDFFPQWSPDGERIAFMRKYKYSPRDDQICLIPPDSVPEPQCMAPAGVDLVELESWWGPDAVLVRLDSASTEVTAVLHLDTGRWERLPIDPSGAVRVSPDHQWVVFQGRVRGDPNDKWWVAPTSRPLDARPLLPTDTTVRIISAAWKDRRPPDYLQTLSFAVARDTLALGLAHRFTIAGLSTNGRSVPLTSRLRWSVDDSMILTLTSQGVATARRAGRTVVRVDLPGWRSDSLAVVVVGESPHVVLRESWDTTWHERWHLIGTPIPQVAAGPDGVRGFWNRGDGSYASNGFTLNEWSGRAGLGAEAELSTPVEGLQFQQLQLYLESSTSGSALALWDSATGAAPSGGGAVNGGACGFTYPNGDGVAALSRAALDDGHLTKLAVGPWIREKAWYRLRVQLFPDGTCGIAINGVPIWHSDRPISLNEPFRLSLGYSSKDALILVGPLEVWQGVKPDLDWASLDTLDGHPLPLAHRPGKR